MSREKIAFALLNRAAAKMEAMEAENKALKNHIRSMKRFNVKGYMIVICYGFALGIVLHWPIEIFVNLTIK